MDIRKDATIELVIQSLALGGNGVGRCDDLVVFVPGAYPGERVRARVTRRKPSYAEAALLEVLVPSPARRDAPCVHFRSRECGGCRSQDLDDRAQVEAKTAQVRETLARLGGPALRDVEVRSCVAAPAVWRYRNKMEFAFHPGPDGLTLLGLHGRDRFDDVFDLVECWIASERTNAIVRETRAFARAATWPAYHARLHTGLVRFLAVRDLPATGQAAVNLIVTRDAVPDVERWAARIADLDPAIRSVVLTVNDARANVATGSRERVLAGGPTIEERLLGLTFEVSANSFLQTNSAQAEALYEAAIEEAALTGAESVLDLYCGAGTITLALARHAAFAVGVEAVEGAIADARRNAARNGIANARFVCGDARAVLRQWARIREGRVLSPAGARAHDAKAPLDPGAYEPFVPDVVLVDPPRAGLHERVIERVAAFASRRIVYVSCNPGTLARDLALFARLGYATRRVRPFDMFPHTPHIECVARLEPGRDQSMGEVSACGTAAGEVPARA